MFYSTHCLPQLSLVILVLWQFVLTTHPYLCNYQSNVDETFNIMINYILWKVSSISKLNSLPRLQPHCDTYATAWNEHILVLPIIDLWLGCYLYKVHELFTKVVQKLSHDKLLNILKINHNYFVHWSAKLHVMAFIILFASINPTYFYT